jgi:hypothetical protein
VIYPNTIAQFPRWSERPVPNVEIQDVQEWGYNIPRSPQYIPAVLLMRPVAWKWFPSNTDIEKNVLA